jgi:hypothetical protein
VFPPKITIQQTEFGSFGSSGKDGVYLMTTKNKSERNRVMTIKKEEYNKRTRILQSIDALIENQSGSLHITENMDRFIELADLRLKYSQTLICKPEGSK